jgi:hypothetical protein
MTLFQKGGLEFIERSHVIEWRKYIRSHKMTGKDEKLHLEVSGLLKM